MSLRPTSPPPPKRLEQELIQLKGELIGPPPLDESEVKLNNAKTKFWLALADSIATLTGCFETEYNKRSKD